MHSEDRECNKMEKEQGYYNGNPKEIWLKMKKKRIKKINIKKRNVKKKEKRKPNDKNEDEGKRVNI